MLLSERAMRELLDLLTLLGSVLLPFQYVGEGAQDIELRRHEDHCMSLVRGHRVGGTDEAGCNNLLTTICVKAPLVQIRRHGRVGEK